MGNHRPWQRSLVQPTAAAKVQLLRCADMAPDVAAKPAGRTTISTFSPQYGACNIERQATIRHIAIGELIRGRLKYRTISS
jgi:hypothetical protein